VNRIIEKKKKFILEREKKKKKIHFLNLNFTLS
jgi:hypothetical protein